MIWLLIAVMTGAAVLAVVWPLARRAQDLRSASDVAVYKDQLEEIERDQGFGLIAPAEADAARVEVSRRLIAAADASTRRGKPAPDSPPRRRRVVAVGALVALPVAAIAVYLAVGSPDLPGQPLTTRVAQAHGGDQSVEAMFARVEQHLEQSPDDGRGWEVVAPIYMRLGRFDDAVKARRNVLRLLGANAERWSDLGEALVALENGVVTGEAKAAFDTALRLDAKDVPARFYSGLAAEQDGRKDEAARIWRELVADAPEGAGWLPSVQQALARLDSSAAAPLAPSPSTAGPAPQQNDMIQAMVAKLAARLQKDGSDVDGWIQLVRSYTVLKDAAKARAAGDDARRALANEPDKLARLEAGIKDIAAGLAAASEPPAGAPQSPEMTIDQMVARLAARLQKDGSNVDGWIQLVRSYTVLKQDDKARAAGDDARRALANDPDKLARLEAGLKDLAAHPPVSEQEPSASNAVPTAPAAPAASAVPAGPPQPQDQMIRGMVERLATRLQKDGSDVDGWIQLVRSYTVLKDDDKARAAGDDARRALANDPDKLARLEAGIKDIAAHPPTSEPTPSASNAVPTAPAASVAPAGPPQPQDQMIRGMVERLATRLHEDGSDVDGWLRLLRSYMVLGEAEKARAAAADARSALKNDPDKLRRLDEGAKSLGVGG
jgi:cytochrome c-type biogenesis protein CcmH